MGTPHVPSFPKQDFPIPILAPLTLASWQPNPPRRKHSAPPKGREPGLPGRGRGRASKGDTSDPPWVPLRLLSCPPPTHRPFKHFYSPHQESTIVRPAATPCHLAWPAKGWKGAPWAPPTRSRPHTNGTQASERTTPLSRASVARWQETGRPATPTPLPSFSKDRKLSNPPRRLTQPPSTHRH